MSDPEMTPTEEQIDRLLEEARESGPGSKAANTLNQLLRGNAQAQEIAAQLLMDESQMIAELRTDNAANWFEHETVFPQKPRNSTRLKLGHTSLLAGLAAMIALSTTFFLLGRATFSNSFAASAMESTDDGVAQLAHSVGVVWVGEEQPQTGASLSPGVFKIEKGIAQIEFYSGAQVIVEGPAELELVSAYRTWCRRGKLTARVPKQAHGFTILTPSFEVIDLGTEFGMDLTEDGEARLQVFDGEIELHAQGKTQSFLGGQAVKIDRTGNSTNIPESSANFASFSSLQGRAKNAADAKLAKWREWSASLAEDPNLVAHYDFEPQTIGQNAVVGCEPTEGRWPGKGGLEFRRSGDRVRVDIPGEFDALTMSAWIRVDALPGRRQALLLTEDYKLGHVHWQIGPEGEVRLGARAENKGMKTSGNASPVVFDAQQLGVWSFVCSTYDRKTRLIRHYLNGREVSRHRVKASIPLQIGSGDIGNWSVPVEAKRTNPVRNLIGRIDEMTIWSTALSAKEIRMIYKNHRP